MDKLLSELKTQSVVVYKDGNEIYKYGDIKYKMLIRSCRKSFMNCMIGILIKNGKLNVNQTIRELGIDDIGGLTDEEKNATILDLLKAKSGIYHPSAYESELMRKNRPERGSHKPGEFWYYNNWDFNVLGFIYNKFSNSDFYKDLCDILGKELGFEDLMYSDCEYVYELEYSLYPAYDFKMSTRDMAKFGLLYLNSGIVNNKQIIDKEWIDTTVYPYTMEIKKNPWPGNGYGLMWWIDNEWDGYGAFGVGGHMIAVVPNKNMVIVHRVDNDVDENNKVGVDDLNKIIGLCMMEF